MSRIRVSTIAVLALLASPAFGSSYDNDMEKLSKEVRSNSITSGSVWLEMQNVVGEWERMMLIFGYAGSGDNAACQRVQEIAEAENPGRSYRCEPVQ